MSAETKKRESIVQAVEIDEAPEYDTDVAVGKINALVDEDHSHEIKLRTMSVNLALPSRQSKTLAHYMRKQ